MCPLLTILLTAGLAACDNRQSTQDDAVVWRIAYTANYDDNWDVHLLDIDTGERTNLTDHPATDYLINTWETEVLISSDREEKYTPGTWRYYFLNQSSGELSNFPKVPMWDSRMGRSPSGNRYVLSLYENEQRRVAIMRDDGVLERYLTEDSYWSSEPDWSPDGEWVVYLSKRAGATDLWRSRPDGSELQQLTNDPANDDERGYGGEGPARWSPDGKQLLWMSWRDDAWQVCTMAPDGADQHCIAQGSRPAWSPDGRQIAFQRSNDGNYDIYLINADGSGLRQLAGEQAFEGGPMWVRLPGG